MAMKHLKSLGIHLNPIDSFANSISMDYDMNLYGFVLLIFPSGIIFGWFAFQDRLSHLGVGHRRARAQWQSKVQDLRTVIRCSKDMNY